MYTYFERIDKGIEVVRGSLDQDQRTTIRNIEEV